jgi:hypothetical protein
MTEIYKWYEYIGWLQSRRDYHKIFYSLRSGSSLRIELVQKLSDLEEKICKYETGLKSTKNAYLLDK